MGGVVAALSLKGEDVVPCITKMLRVIGHRNGIGCGLFSPKVSVYSKSPPELLAQDIHSPICLGYNLSKTYKLDSEPITHLDEFSSVLDGSLSNFRDLFEISHKEQGSDKIRRFLERSDGDYVLLSIKKDNLMAFRDPVGTVPLYIGENEGLLALASEKKALWAIGLRDVESFPPGCLLEAGKTGRALNRVKEIYLHKISSNRTEEITRRLASLIRRAVDKRVKNVGGLALAFSGGLDSSVLAKILQEMEIPVHLICVGMETGVEVEHAETVASELGLPISVEMFERRDVEEIVSRVLWYVEDFNPLKVSLGVPFYWLCQEARRLGKDFLMTGQGSDELFGGYMRHLRVFQTQSSDALDEMLLRDVRKAHEVSYELNSHVCSAFGIVHVAPYADFDLIDYGLGVPPVLKMRFEGETTRKGVLRGVAKELGLPESVYRRPKKAMQYGTGVDKVLHNMAKDKGLSVEEYLRRLFFEVFREITLK